MAKAIKVFSEKNAEADIPLRGLSNFMKPGTWEYDEIRKLEANNEIIDGYEPDTGYLVKKRTEIETSFESYQGIYYDLEKPVMYYDDLSTKLVVMFPPASGEGEVAASKRLLNLDVTWPSFTKRVANNTYVLRIADSNLMSGSFFLNTENFPDYQEKVQALIQKVMTDIGVSHERVICYGGSRGGTGALIHGILGNYETVALEPLVNLNSLTGNIAMFDQSFICDNLPSNLIPKLQAIISASQYDKEKIRVISSSGLLGSFPFLQDIADDITLYDLDFKMYYKYTFSETHRNFTKQTFPLVLKFINDFLYSFDLSIAKRRTFDIWAWPVRMPWFTSPNWTFRLLDDCFEISRTSLHAEEQLEMDFFPALEKGHYQLQFTLKEAAFFKHLILKSDAGHQEIQMSGMSGNQVLFDFEAQETCNQLLFDDSYPEDFVAKISGISIKKK
jgi:hypothetical protein